MPLPLGVLRAAVEQPVMVELKNGDTLSGKLVSCDGFMNLHVRDLVCTARDGEHFWSMERVYVRGNNVKYIRLGPGVLDAAIAAQKHQTQQQLHNKDNADGGAGRGTGPRGALDRQQKNRRDRWQQYGGPISGSGRGRGVPPGGNHR